MSICPVRFLANGDVEVWHYQANHGGTIAIADVRFAQTPDGGDDLRFIELACPVPGCGVSTLHPASGGSDPDQVQRLFVRKLMNCPAPRSWDQAKAALHASVVAMDEADRWRLDGVAENA